MVNDVDNSFKTLIDMPTKIHALVVKIGGWYYILYNSKINFEQQIKACLHELKHIELHHLDNYDIKFRNYNEKEVNNFLECLKKGRN